ncbi:MAG: siroheme synthase, partial [Acidimicrobiia bacterium]|nr:siroheme synthase [Acidimicrobiia bacterium]
MSGIVVQLVLAGHRCLVVGAGRVGARKVDALLAAGATVVVVAPELDEHLEGLAASGTAELVLHRRRFVASDVDGCALVVAATDDPRVNELAAAAAAAAGALVNRADRSG